MTCVVTALAQCEQRGEPAISALYIVHFLLLFQPLGQYQSAPCKSLRVFALCFSCYVSRGALSVSAVGVVVGARPVSVVVGPLGVRSRRVGSEEVLAWLHMDAVLL